MYTYLKFSAHPVYFRFFEHLKFKQPLVKVTNRPFLSQKTTLSRLNFSLHPPRLLCTPSKFSTYTRIFFHQFRESRRLEKKNLYTKSHIGNNKRKSLSMHNMSRLRVSSWVCKHFSRILGSG